MHEHFVNHDLEGDEPLGVALPIGALVDGGKSSLRYCLSLASFPICTLKLLGVLANTRAKS